MSSHQTQTEMGIVTVTVNPALDVSSHVPSVSPNRKLRCSQPVYEPGGGGINVARAIHRLGGESLAVWTRGGVVGDLLEDLLNEERVPNLPIPINGMTRQNFVVREETSDLQYRFCHPGPALSDSDQAQMIEHIGGFKPAPNYLVISGGPTPGLKSEFWAHLIDALPEDCRIVVDTSGVSIGHPTNRPLFLYKSNIAELSRFMDNEVVSDADLVMSAKCMINQGLAENVVTSLGAGGALLVSADKHFHIKAPTVPIVSRVGAGDSMTAGMVLALSREESIEDAFKWGIAAGTAAVMTPGTQLCRREDAEELFDRIINL